MCRALIPLVLLALIAAAPQRLTEPQVRAFVARQSQLWNAGDLRGYFATFAPAARFTDQALANSNTIVPYGSSTIAQARALARKALAKGPAGEAAAIDRVILAPDGHGARVSAHVVSQSAGARFCAQRIETLALTPRGVFTTAQTDTIVRCRPAGVR